MQQIKGVCGMCGISFQRPAVQGVPLGFCSRCWTKADRHMLERDALGDKQAEEWPEDRMDAIGANGPTGCHYRDINLPAQGSGLDEAGRKDDAEKPRMDLLLADMPRALEAIVQVLTHGASKYSPGNWQHVPDAQRRYLAAGARHELELAKGFAVDDESGEHHLAHAACCILFRLELQLREES